MLRPCKQHSRRQNPILFQRAIILPVQKGITLDSFLKSASIRPTPISRILEAPASRRLEDRFLHTLPPFFIKSDEVQLININLRDMI